MADCVAYLTIDDVRDEFGDDVDSMTDAQIQRRIDRLVAFLEGEIGHTFGRALIARSSGGGHGAGDGDGGGDRRGYVPLRHLCDAGGAGRRRSTGRRTRTG